MCVVGSAQMPKASVSLEKGVRTHGSFPLEALLSAEILAEGQEPEDQEGPRKFHVVEPKRGRSLKRY